MMKFSKGEKATTRNLENANIAVSPICLCCMGMSHACGDGKNEANLTIDEVTSLEEMFRTRRSMKRTFGHHKTKGDTYENSTNNFR
jgi:hypothetical protein